MANNKKKLRKKLRNELMQKSTTPVAQTNISVDKKEPLNSAVIDYSHNQTKEINKPNSSTDALDHIHLINRDILLIVSIFLILVIAMIVGKYYDNTSGWVLDFANFLFSKF